MVFGALLPARQCNQSTNMSLNVSEIQVIAFDAFGTVFDLSTASRDEVRGYVSQLRKPEWAPLVLPAAWASMPAFPDAAEGIRELRNKYVVVSLSNGPTDLLVKMSKANGVDWDDHITLALKKVYKTNHEAYRAVCETLNVDPTHVLMVTANRTFGDLEASVAVGMQSILIRDGDGPKTITDLAKLLAGFLG